jgi:hypothetical protein
MAIRQTEFSISIEKLEIKFKGTQELGQQIQQGVTQAIGGLMNAQARLLTARDEPAQVVDGTVIDGTGSSVNGHDTSDGAAEKAKQPRQRRTRSGPSIANLLLGLKQERYFSQARASGEVLSYLKDSKAHNLRGPAVMTELQRMVQKNDADPAKLYRNKNDSGDYVYKETPFNDDPRSPSPTEHHAP